MVMGGGVPLCHSDIGILLRVTGIGSKDEYFPRLENIWLFGIGATLSHRDANVSSAALRTCILFIPGFWYQLHYSAITDKNPPQKTWDREVILKDLQYNQHN